MVATSLYKAPENWKVWKIVFNFRLMSNYRALQDGLTLITGHYRFENRGAMSKLKRMQFES